jgi:hypothetical protein
VLDLGILRSCFRGAVSGPVRACSGKRCDARASGIGGLSACGTWVARAGCLCLPMAVSASISQTRARHVHGRVKRAREVVRTVRPWRCGMRRRLELAGGALYARATCTCLRYRWARGLPGNGDRTTVAEWKDVKRTSGIPVSLRNARAPCRATLGTDKEGGGVLHPPRGDTHKGSVEPQRHAGGNRRGRRVV